LDQNVGELLSDWAATPDETFEKEAGAGIFGQYQHQKRVGVDRGFMILNN